MIQDFKCSAVIWTKQNFKIKQKSNVIYEFTYPSCQQQCIGKTDHCIIKWLNKHATREDQTLHQHLRFCSDFFNEVDHSMTPLI